MRRIFQILFIIITCILPALASANSVEYVIDDQIFSGNFADALQTQADVFFHRNSNHFGGKMFFQDIKTVDKTYIQLGSDEKVCNKQVRGFYINSARGNRVRPLDEDSLVYLKSIDSSYDTLTLTGGIFVCSTPSNALYGYIQHTWHGVTYSLIAWAQYNFVTNRYTNIFDDVWSLIFNNLMVDWYVWDNYGGIAEIYGSWLNVTYVCGDGLIEAWELCDEWALNGVYTHCNTTCNGTYICDENEAPIGGMCEIGTIINNNLTGSLMITWTIVISWYTSTGATLVCATGTIITIINTEDVYTSIEIPCDPWLWSFIAASGGVWDGDISAPIEMSGEATLPELARDLPAETSTASYTYDIITTIKAGSDEAELRPSTGYFTINIHVWSEYNGKTVNVYRSEDGDHWIKNSPDETCDVVDNICSFQTNHLSFFAPAKLITTIKNTWSNGWWGWWGWVIVKDQCPENRDCSNSYYDSICGPCSLVEKIKNQVTDIIHGAAPVASIENSSYSAELNDAYLRSYSVGITTMPTVQQANLTGKLLRKYAAKMISQFATNVLSLKPNNLVVCNFKDISAETPETQYYMRLACKLGFMWLEADGTPNTVFNPNGEVTRAQFGTMLSRLLYGSKYNAQPGLRYDAHLQALQSAGIMTKISQPFMLELRGYVMLMMQRVSKK